MCIRDSSTVECLIRLHYAFTSVNPKEPELLKDFGRDRKVTFEVGTEKVPNLCELRRGTIIRIS